MADTPTVALRGKTVTIPLRTSATDETVRDVPLLFTANSLCEIEETWGNIDAWSKALETKPFTTLRATLSIATGMPAEEVGACMIVERLDVYGAGIGAAFAIANGVDPTQAMAASTQRMAEAQEARAVVAEALETTTATTGTDGSEPGAAQVVALTSSGD